ncbi:MAG: Flagellar L-ring protein FlgH, partial [uncultured Craurococcus sp.]
ARRPPPRAARARWLRLARAPLPRRPRARALGAPQPHRRPGLAPGLHAHARRAGSAARREQPVAPGQP